MFALALVDKRGELLKLLRCRVLSEKGDDVLDAAFMRRERLKRIADKEQIALNDAVRAPAATRSIMRDAR
jgi:hypothetical protein